MFHILTAYFPSLFIFWITCLARAMYSPMRKDYVALTLRDQYSHNYTNGKQWRRQSCWRVRLHAEYKVKVEKQWHKNHECWGWFAGFVCVFMCLPYDSCKSCSYEYAVVLCFNLLLGCLLAWNSCGPVAHDLLAVFTRLRRSKPMLESCSADTRVLKASSMLPEISTRARSVFQVAVEAQQRFPLLEVSNINAASVLQDCALTGRIVSLPHKMQWDSVSKMHPLVGNTRQLNLCLRSLVWHGAFKWWHAVMSNCWIREDRL